MGERNKIPISVQLIVQNEEKILLLKRKNTGYEDGKYCLPGGHLEKNEEIRSAIIREAKEEIGIDIRKKDLELYKILNRKIEGGGEYIDFIFKISSWNGEIKNKEIDKCEELIWRNKKDLPENTLGFVKEVFKDGISMYIPYNWKED